MGLEEDGQVGVHLGIQGSAHGHGIGKSRFVGADGEVAVIHVLAVMVQGIQTVETGEPILGGEQGQHIVIDRIPSVGFVGAYQHSLQGLQPVRFPSVCGARQLDNTVFAVGHEIHPGLGGLHRNGQSRRAMLDAVGGSDGIGLLPGGRIVQYGPRLPLGVPDREGTVGHRDVFLSVVLGGVEAVGACGEAAPRVGAVEGLADGSILISSGLGRDGHHLGVGDRLDLSTVIGQPFQVPAAYGGDGLSLDLARHDHRDAVRTVGVILHLGGDRKVHAMVAHLNGTARRLDGGLIGRCFPARADNEDQHAEGYDAGDGGGRPAAAHESGKAPIGLFHRGDDTALGGDQGVLGLQEHTVGQGLHGGEGVQGAFLILFHTWYPLSAR